MTSLAVVLAITVCAASTGCTRSNAIMGTLVSAGIVAGGTVLLHGAESDSEMGEGYAALAIISGGSLLLVGSLIALVVSDPEPAPPTTTQPGASAATGRVHLSFRRRHMRD